MASGLQPVHVVGPGSVPTHKGQQSHSTSTGCLPFSHSRQHSDNFPDVLDNDNYFPTYSEGVSNVNINTEQPMPSSSRVDQSAGESNPGFRVSDSYEPRISEINSNVLTSVADTLPYENEQSENVSGRPIPVQLPTYRQIQTRDINVGVSARLDHRSDALPDILHSHVPQPVRPAAVPPQHRTSASRPDRRTRTQEARNQRTRDTPSRSTRHGHRNRSRSTSSSQMDDAVCKAPCVRCFVKVTSFRWVLVVLSLLGVCCVVTGIVLAALHAVGNSFLFLAIMFIGLGVLLVIVVGVGWKCTPRGHEPLHALFGIGDFQRRRDRRQHRTHRNRDNNWYGGVLYPEFQYRRPPPSYAASMQEYQQQLYLAQQQQQQIVNTPPNATNTDNYSLPSSPPPSYRSRASTIHSGIHITFPPNQEDYPDSRPPTYRSRRGSAHPRPPIPREEFESMDREDNAPADVSFAGPDNSAQQRVVNNPSSNPAHVSNDRRDTVPQHSDSTVTVNGMVIEPSVSSNNSDHSAQTTVTNIPVSSPSTNTTSDVTSIAVSHTAAQPIIDSHTNVNTPTTSISQSITDSHTNVTRRNSPNKEIADATEEDQQRVETAL